MDEGFVSQVTTEAATAADSKLPRVLARKFLLHITPLTCAFSGDKHRWTGGTTKCCFV